MNNREIKTRIWVERDGIDIEVDVTVDYRPGCPESRYPRHGAPHPGDPPSMEVLEAVAGDQEIELSAEEEERVFMQIYDDGI